MSPEGKRIVITGAASGIGKLTAAKLRAQGHAVAGLDLHASDDIIACDVGDQVSVNIAIAAAIEQLRGIDVLVNCAGIGPVQSAGARPGQDAQRVIDINLMGPWRVTGAAMDALLESRGRVVNVSSGLAFMAVPLAPAYCMSKRGVVAYSDALRYEYAGRLEAVTTVYPGYIRTPIHDDSKAAGFTLEGLVPAETVDDAADTLVRACVGPPARDLATTRSGEVSYALARGSSRRLLDRLVLARLKRAVRKGHGSESAIAADFVAALG